MRSAFHSLVICRREAAPHSRPCRILAVLGVLGVLAAHNPMKFLAGGPATGKRHSLRAAQPLGCGIPLAGGPPIKQFSKIFFYPLARGPRICYPCAVSRRAGLSQGAR